MRIVTETMVDEPRQGAARRGKATPALRVVDSPDVQSIDVLVEVDKPMLIGRAGGAAQLTFKDSRVSGEHLRLGTTRGQPLSFEDAGSRNGTYVNGERKTSGTLAIGDVLRIGSTFAVVTTSSAEGPTEDVAHDLIGDAPAFRHACRRIIETAHSDLTVLLLGETGAGKEVMASLVHRASKRSGPYVPVNCTAIPEQLADAAFFGHEKGAYTGASQSRIGYFRDADGGTLFLDEVGDLPAAIQPRLLRALEQKEVVPVGSTRARPIDVRIVAATNVDLAAAVADGRFRADLYARLRAWTVELPPLRDRREDVLRLARHFLGAPPTPSDQLWEADVAEACLLYHWPFNVRELRQVMRGLAAIRTGPPYKLSQLPAFMQAANRSGPRVVVSPAGSRATHGDRTIPEGRAITRRGTVSREEFLEVMETLDHNVSAVARFFERDRKQIYRWMERYGVARDGD